MTTKTTFALLPFVFLLATAFSCRAENESPTGSAERKFEFTYSATIKEVPDGAKEVDLWIPIPQDSKHQDISRVKVEAWTKSGDKSFLYKPDIGVELVHGNKMAHWRLEAQQAKGLVATLTVECKRKEISAADLSKARDLTEKEIIELAPYLQPNRLVQVGGAFQEYANNATRGANTPLEIARAAYDYTVSTMKYDKPQDKPGWGKGSTQWACDSKFGNCTDFHAMIMSIDRTKGIPVKFEMGFPLPARAPGAAASASAVGGYHCWAKFYLGGVGWVPLDASEAYKNPALKSYYFGNLTPDRIQFTAGGRDVDLIPRQAGDALNYFIYPYAEADGKPFTVDKAFSYKDVE